MKFKNTKWTKKGIDNFFYENYNILVENNHLIEFKKIKSKGSEFYNWYQAIVRETNNVYSSMEDFYKKH